MHKQKRLIIIMACAIVILVGVMLVPKIFPPAEETEATTTTAAVEAMIDYVSSEIEQIEIEGLSDDVILIPEVVDTGDGDEIAWKLTDLEGLPADQDRIDSFASSLINLSPDREIEASASDLDKYGLQTPAFTVVYKLKDGRINELRIGDTLGSGSGAYASVKNRVCAISSSLKDSLASDLLDWLDKAAPVAIDYNSVTVFSMERSRDQMFISADCKFTGDPEDNQTPALSFTVNEPVTRAGDTEALSAILTQISSLSATEYIELEPQDLSAYGLDTPNYRFVISSAKQDPVEIILGSEAGSGSVYAMSSELDAVFTTDSSNLTSLDTPLLDLLDPFINLHNIGRVSKIEAEIEDISFVTEISVDPGQSASDDSTVFKLDGEDAKIFSQTNNNLYSRFYQSIIGIMISGIDTEAVPENTADSRLVFHLEKDEDTGDDARVEIVEFAHRDDYTDYVFIDNEYTGCYISRDDAFYSQDSGSEGIVTAYKMMKYAMGAAVDGVFDTEDGYKLD
jgi:hypothetical protein